MTSSLSSSSSSSSILLPSTEKDQPVLPAAPEIRQCWICYGEESISEGDLGGSNVSGRWVKPCRCRGSTKWVHQECLLSWVDLKLVTPTDFSANATSIRTSSAPLVAATAHITCPQCHAEYSISERYVLPKSLLAVIDRACIWRERTMMYASLLGFGTGVYTLCFAYGVSTLMLVLGPAEATRFFTHYLQLGATARYGQPQSQVVLASAAATMSPPYPPPLAASVLKVFIGVPLIPIYVLSASFPFLSWFYPLIPALVIDVGNNGGSATTLTWPPSPRVSALMLPLVLLFYQFGQFAIPAWFKSRLALPNTRPPASANLPPLLSTTMASLPESPHHHTHQHNTVGDSRRPLDIAAAASNGRNASNREGARSLDEHMSESLMRHLNETTSSFTSSHLLSPLTGTADTDLTSSLSSPTGESQRNPQHSRPSSHNTRTPSTARSARNAAANPAAMHGSQQNAARDAMPQGLQGGGGDASEAGMLFGSEWDGNTDHHRHNHTDGYGADGEYDEGFEEDELNSEDEDEEMRVVASSGDAWSFRQAIIGVTSNILFPAAAAFTGWLLFGGQGKLASRMRHFDRTLLGGVTLLAIKDLFRALYWYQTVYLKRYRRILDYPEG